jgi:hypothetical protein
VVSDAAGVTSTLPTGPSLEFGYRGSGDHRNPFALQTLHQLLSSPIVGRRGRRPRAADQWSSARSAYIAIQGRSRHHRRGSFATRHTADNGVPFHHQLVP